MAGYILQGKTESGAMVDIPLAATYDSAGNNIIETYAAKQEYETIMSKLGVMDEKLDLVLAGASLELASWSTIKKIADLGVASSFWKVGDEKSVTLTTGEKITLVILGFNHDNAADGSGKAGITFGTKNCLTTIYPMNSTATNSGGWGSSIMRTSTMTTLLNYLPEDVRAVIKPVAKKTSSGSTTSTIVTTTDSLFLFSVEEVMGTNMMSTTAQNSFAGEGEQYEYFKNAPTPTPNSGTGSFSVLEGTGDFYTTSTSVASGYMNRFAQSKSTLANYYYNYNNAKATGDSGTTASTWWLRSPSSSSSNGFCCVHSIGGSSNNGANYGYGVAFGFCV